MSWQSAGSINSTSYTCGFCGNLVASSTGYISIYNHQVNKKIHICPHCRNPTFFFIDGKQIPDVAPGNSILHLPSEINELYNEARHSVSAGAYTGSVLLCRKLLMNIAVSMGAEEGKQFIVYVNYLAEQGYIPPNGRAWVDHIRKKGNEATHEIALMIRQDAEELISFAEMLMKFIYEFPNKIPQQPG